MASSSRARRRVLKTADTDARPRPRARLTNPRAATMPHANTSFLSALTREIPKAWPFFTGIGAVGVAVVYATMGITEADKKASKFVNPGGH